MQVGAEHGRHLEEKKSRGCVESPDNSRVIVLVSALLLAPDTPSAAPCGRHHLDGRRCFASTPGPFQYCGPGFSCHFSAALPRLNLPWRILALRTAFSGGMRGLGS
jgi:hypothetical protein